MKQQKVWFVTGASKGFGLSIVKQLLAKGIPVAATTRNLSELNKAVGEDDNFLPLAVDLTSEKSVEDAIAATVSKFGRIDIVVNNAGYGLVGGLEELSDAEGRQNFDVNVFGLLHVIRKALPYLRTQGAGHIINFSSIGGLVGDFPGFGIYCATKFAVNGLTEALAAEVKPFGIHATIVSPGYFRTNFLASDSLVIPKHPIDAYTNVRDSQRAHQQSIDGNQPGDPEKAATAVIKITEVENPPLHFFLGTDAYELAGKKLDSLRNELETWKELTVSTAIEA
ncbi:NADP-dependent 3-hydroxy acid dehydrogenase YdfG [Chitinophaga sp. YR627]|uniref:oxidoreductase n=1 Tax=Chitinophaga sp. YR627 TaxID=1881041 RepID=UPI0008E3E8DA|nr:oxidoreductase [Chitinophaga sp. YR627]SFO59400.1 NADP-dependent 3-hydroxy acid dehydrogenase YdfG [Chitinophaga sp. YR627]